MKPITECGISVRKINVHPVLAIVACPAVCVTQTQPFSVAYTVEHCMLKTKVNCCRTPNKLC